MVVCGHLGPGRPRFEKIENAVTWVFGTQVQKTQVTADSIFANLGPAEPLTI